MNWLMLETWTWGPGLRPKLWMLPKQQRRPKKKRLNMMRKRYFTTLNMKSKNLCSFFEGPNVDYCKHYQCTWSNKAAQYFGGQTNLLSCVSIHTQKQSVSAEMFNYIFIYHILSQLPREWSDPVAWQGCSSPGSYSIPVAPAGARNGRHGQLQSRWPQGAWVLVWRRDPEKEGDPHCEGNLCQDSSWVWFLFYAKRKWEPFFFYFNDAMLTDLL